VAARSVGAAVSGSKTYRSNSKSALATSPKISTKIAATRLRRRQKSHYRIPLWRRQGRPVSFVCGGISDNWGNPAAFAAKRATTSIPILIGSAGDVVNTGLISNIARPESNLTGFIALNVELEEKRLELLKEVIPRLSRVAVLANTANPLNLINLDTARRVAQRLGVTIEVVDVKSDKNVESALVQIKGLRPDAVLLASDNVLLGDRKQIVEAMAANSIPAIYPFREYADVGGLLIYGANLSVLFERAADYLDKLLKGAKPGDLPVQQATAFELIINLKAALGLGLTVPPSVLARADEVIE
jgi:ABC-type uncharacterized transport system substrate-binding protein